MANLPAGSLPSQMIAAYSRIVVPLDPPFTPVTVSVQKYACQHPGYGGGQVERMAFKDRLLGAIGGGRGLSVNRLTASAFVGVFSGKGSMDEIATCLALAARHNVFHHRPHNLTFAESGLTLNQRLQKVADDYIGLDCNGFVGNWAIYNAVAGASASHLPLDWISGRRVRTTLAAIEQYDIVAWANGNHIGMIETVGALGAKATSMDVVLAESSKGGMLTHPGSHITFNARAVPAARGPWQTHFSLQNDIHGNMPVVIASMARNH